MDPFGLMNEEFLTCCLTYLAFLGYPKTYEKRYCRLLAKLRNVGWSLTPPRPELSTIYTTITIAF